MVTLRNIHKVGHALHCEVYVEDSTEPMAMSLDIQSGSFSCSPLPKGYEYCTMHISKARRALKKMAESGEIQPNWTVMWY